MARSAPGRDKRSGQGALARRQGQVLFAEGVSSLHFGIEFGRSRTGEGSSGREKKGVV